MSPLPVEKEEKNEPKAQKLILHHTVHGKGVPLVILHGLFGMSDNWATLSKQYAASGFQVILMDLRNHGHSGHEPMMNYTVMAEDVLNTLLQIQLEKVHIIGHSMGGKVAMTFACLYPELIDKLIVADIAPKYYAPHHQDVLEAIESVMLEKITARSEAEIQLREHLIHEGTIQFLLKNLYWKNGVDGNKNLAWRFNFEAIKNNIDLVGEELPYNAHFAGPTLFIKGSNSNYIMPEDENIMAIHFSNYQLESVSSAAHWLHADNPTEFLAKTNKFLTINT